VAVCPTQFPCRAEARGTVWHGPWSRPGYRCSAAPSRFKGAS